MMTLSQLRTFQAVARLNSFSRAADELHLTQPAVSSQIVALENALDMYKLDNYRYPLTAQGLKALVEKPTASPIPENYNAKGYIKRLPQDPWGNEYLLVSPGEHGDYDILSAGQDGEPGTADDITNWELGKAK